ncbi:MAG TPA: 16S rRNA (uracil(1498)-N(3))-methyltransferase [Telluria sp.]|nr:16S rRNA (uracil(1498)-N(3))-methyltransferase [Telluria sp.]
MPRFYCPPPLTSGLAVDLPEAVAHHLHVLRLPPGAPLTLFDGRGGEYAATLLECGKRRASALVGAHAAREAELPYAVTLAQGLPEGAKMDWIVEKAVEMGVAAVQPVAARRSVVKLAGERAERKVAHWEAIVTAASEQCGRNRLMRIAAPLPLERCLAGAPALLLSPRGTLGLADWARRESPRDLTLLIGPEGGYAPEEEAAALAAGAVAVSMGARVLRTETAAVAALGMLAGCWMS